MSNTDIITITLIAYLWIAGGHSTYLGMVATRSVPANKKSIQVLAYMAWPVLFLFAIGPDKRH